MSKKIQKAPSKFPLSEFELGLKSELTAGHETTETGKEMRNVRSLKCEPERTGVDGGQLVGAVDIQLLQLSETEEGVC